MKNTSCILLVILIAIINSFGQTENPYSEFGYKGVVLDAPSQEFEKVTYANYDTLSHCSKIAINFKLHLIAFLDKNDNVLLMKFVSPDALLRWLTIDPAHQYSSPYLGMGNNPVSGVDPDGRSLSPIYGSNGEGFLGTDDLGIQGEAIVMDKGDFTQGMAHDRAIAVGTFFHALSSDQMSMFFDHGFDHYRNLRNRPDWDGFVTIGEGIAWAKTHPNILPNKYTPDDVLYLDASKMNFGSLGRADFPSTGKETYVNLLYKFNGNSTAKHTIYALGQTHMILLSYAEASVEVVNGSWNNYDWDIHGSFLRQTLIRGERIRANLNDTHGFPTYIYGVGHLSNMNP